MYSSVDSVSSGQHSQRIGSGTRERPSGDRNRDCDNRRLAVALDRRGNALRR